LSKSIKNDITFEKKLHDEVPSGKNYIIKNIKGKDFVVVKNLEGQNKDNIALHIIKQLVSDRSWYTGIVNNILHLSYKGHHFIYRTVLH
jgi:hypothetical protein